MLTEKKEYSPELHWAVFKIRLLSEDDALEFLEFYARKHAIKFGEFCLINWYNPDENMSEKFYTQFIKQKEDENSKI